MDAINTSWLNQAKDGAKPMFSAIRTNRWRFGSTFIGILFVFSNGWADERITVKETGRDKYYVAYAGGIVLDTKHNLMWARQDNGRSLDWNQAEAYCKQFHAGGFNDWRLPTPDELLTLFEPKETNPQGFHLTSLIKLSGKQLWSSNSFIKSTATAKKPAAIYVRFDDDFSAGKALVAFKRKKDEILFHDTWANHRVLPVRSVKTSH